MTRISVNPIATPAPEIDGLRPVNLRADLRPLADLIELVFADSMDSGGRSAIREMRYLSHLGFGLKLISRMNDLALGISLGFVYVEDGKLVGNVSVYPAGYPKSLGETWILANVAVHPDYQRRGIAHSLVDATLGMIRRRGGARVVLQVNYDNLAALRLYERHGFIYERAWRNWSRSGFVRSPAMAGSKYHVQRLRQYDRPAALLLAREARPNELGGIGWLKPVQRDDFFTPLWRRLLQLFTFGGMQRYVIRADDGRGVLASYCMESAMSFSNIRAWLYTAPVADRDHLTAAMLNHVVSRYDRSTIHFEHPRDDDAANDLFKRHQFKVKRELWHMRLEL